MKRPFSLIELIVVLALISIIAPLVANKLPEWKNQYVFSQDRKVIEEALFDAQLLAVLTAQTIHVTLEREAGSPWTISIESFSAVQNSFTAMRKRHEFHSIQLVENKEIGKIVIEFSSPFGDSKEVPISLTPYRGETVQCGCGLGAISKTKHSVIFTDSLLNALETP